MIKKIIKWFKENVDNLFGFAKFIGFVVMLTLTFNLAPRIAYYICNVELENMTNFIKWFLTLLFSTMLLPQLKKGDM